MERVINCIALIIAIIILCACQSAPRVPDEVLIPVPIKCAAVEPTEPAYHAKEGVGADVYTQMKTLLADRVLSQAYIEQLRVALRSCK